MICLARMTSAAEPLAWTLDSGSTTLRYGAALRGVDGSWQEKLESAAWIEEDGRLGIMYAGYRVGQPIGNVSLGIAWSDDGGATFSLGAAPVLEATRGGQDEDALYSPSVVAFDGANHVVYAAHCYAHASCTAPHVKLLGAVCTAAGGCTKHSAAVFDPANAATHSWLLPPGTAPPAATPAWLAQGVAEPHLHLLTDDACRVLLLFTGLGADDDRSIGGACADHPFGPWRVSPHKLMDSNRVLAPALLVGASGSHMFFLNATSELLKITAATAGWPTLASLSTSATTGGAAVVTTTGGATVTATLMDAVSASTSSPTTASRVDAEGSTTISSAPASTTALLVTAIACAVINIV